jgi:hypothetical protein
MADKTVLVYQGKQTTITYDTISNLPILYTASGISSFHRVCANQHYVQQLPSVDHPFFLPHNLTPKQQRKLHLHERCAHANWEQINAWIRAGNLAHPSPRNQTRFVLHANLVKHTNAPTKQIPEIFPTII